MLAAAAAVVVDVVVELIPSSAASSSSSAMVVPATNRGSRDCGVPDVVVVVDTSFFGGDVKRLFPEAAAVLSAVARRLFDSWLESGELDDLGQEKRFELEVVVDAEAESTLPENIFELAKVEVEENDVMVVG